MFARTDRLLLRPGFPEDARAVHAAIADEGIVRNLASAPWPYLPEHAEAFLAAERDPRGPCFLILRRTRGAPELIGTIGFSPGPDGVDELGYYIARRHWGLGYATEAGRAVVEIARAIRVPRLQAGHFLDNPGSGRVLEKLGFKPTGQIVPRFSAGRGEAAPCRLYALDLAEPKEARLPTAAARMAA